MTYGLPVSILGSLGGSPGGLRDLAGSLELWQAFWEMIGGVLEPRFSFFVGGEFVVGIKTYLYVRFLVVFLRWIVSFSDVVLSFSEMVVAKQ